MNLKARKMMILLKVKKRRRTKRRKILKRASALSLKGKTSLSNMIMFNKWPLNITSSTLRLRSQKHLSYLPRVLLMIHLALSKKSKVSLWILIQISNQSLKRSRQSSYPKMLWSKWMLCLLITSKPTLLQILKLVFMKIMGN